MSSAIAAIDRTKFKNAHSYNVVMYMQKLHQFCNIHTPDDGQKIQGK